MTTTFYPTTIEVARLRRQMTIAELSTASGISAREIHRICRSEVSPNGQTIGALAAALDYPVTFFYFDEIDMPVQASFRSRASMTKKEAGAGLASAALGLRLSDWLDKNFDLPVCDLFDLSGLSPELAANSVREQWGLGERPIANVVKLLEAKGIRVFSLLEDTLRLDAFATWARNRPFIFLNGVKSAERSRFDAAHELGHLLLHRDAQQGKEAEDEANAFASAFLMPSKDIIFRRVPPTIPNLIAIKQRWGVSLAALVRRYRDLRLINDDRAKWLYIEMSRNGFLKAEPEGIERESSAVWTRVLQFLWQEKRTVKDIAEEVALPEDEINSLIFVNRFQSNALMPNKRRTAHGNLKLIN